MNKHVMLEEITFVEQDIEHSETQISWEHIETLDIRSLPWDRGQGKKTFVMLYVSDNLKYIILMLNTTPNGLRETKLKYDRQIGLDGKKQLFD